MFRQIKSAIFWYYLYRFRRRVALIVTLVVLIFISDSIYTDIVEYLRLTGKVGYLGVILPLKWIVILSSVFVIAYLILTLFSATKESASSKKEERPLPKKEKIRLSAQQIIERKRAQKGLK